MNCTDETTRELIPDFLAGELNPARATTVEEHLAICLSCKEFAQRVQWFTDGLGQLSSFQSHNHPTEEILVKFVRTPELLAANDRRQLEIHLSVCPDCEALCERTRSVQTELDLHETISLVPFIMDEEGQAANHLAADASDERTLSVECLATHISESPEVILRIMRDHEQGRDYLEVMADDQNAMSHAVIHSPKLQRDFVTDARGKTEIDLGGVADITRLTWQVKATQAVITLDHLEYDPNKTEYSEETILETDRGDKVELRLEGKTEGKTISIKVLEIEGNENYQCLRVSITHDEGSSLGFVEPGKAVKLGPIDCTGEIKIHLY